MSSTYFDVLFTLRNAFSILLELLVDGVADAFGLRLLLESELAVALCLAWRRAQMYQEWVS